MRAIGAAKRRIFAEGFIGRPLAVLIEARSEPATGLPLGFSDNYIPVAVGGGVPANSIVRVLPGSFVNGRLIAEVLHD